MRKVTLGLICLLAVLALVLPLTAQEGYPLKGSWLGDWGATATSRNQMLVVFDWDGKTISGSINPGTEMVVIKNASLTPTAVGPPPGAAPAGGGAGRGAGGGRGQGGGPGAPAAGATVPPLPGAAPAAGGRGGVAGNTLGAQSGGTLAPAPVDWVVHFEGDGKDAKGAAVHYVADGKVENIGLYNRSITGKWVSGAVTGTFKLQRQ